MDALDGVGVNPDLPRETLVAALLQWSEDGLRDMRVKLFDTALNMGLAHPKDVLVKRLKRAVGPTLVTKYANDIADLCYAIRNEHPLPRTLLKNGKRSASVFMASRSRSPSSHLTPHAVNLPSSPPQSPGRNPSPDRNSPDSIFHPKQKGAIASLTSELGSLRRSVTQLKSEVMNLRNSFNSETCVIHVRLKNVELSDLCESLLNTTLNCPTICHSIIRNASTISL